MCVGVVPFMLPVPEGLKPIGIYFIKFEKIFQLFKSLHCHPSTLLSCGNSNNAYYEHHEVVPQFTDVFVFSLPLCAHFG